MIGIFTAALVCALGADAPIPSWGFSFGAGPYQPQMGEQADYYRAIYATEKDSSLFAHRPLMTSVETSWYFLRDAGRLGPFVRLGTWKVSAPTRVCGDADNPASCTAEDVLAGTSRPGSDKTALAVYPLSLGLVYKLDLLERHASIPLVPMVRGAATYVFWRNTTENGLSRRGAAKGEGGTFGLETSLGLALGLGWMEPGAARRGYEAMGITGTYLYGEWTRLYADGFAAQGKLDLSASFIQVGLMFDFE